MTTIGLVGAGHMGAGLGWALRDGGETVVTTLDGRSARTGTLVERAGLAVRPDLATVVRESQVVLVVTPPDAALPAATAIAEAARQTGGRPLVADLNAVSPDTMARVAQALAEAGLDTVDGSISGPTPLVSAGARIYLSGPRAAEVAALGWRHVTPILVGDRVGQASSVKMCTSSVYKGVTGILTQALRAARHYDVVDQVLADLTPSGYAPDSSFAASATKAWRFVAEMREIAATQRAAGLPGELFEAMATVFAELAATELAQGDPESVQAGLSPTEVVSKLHT